MKNNSDMITKTEKQLIHLTKMNSDDGFAELARRYQPLMYKLASEFIDGGRLSPDELPDLMQEMLMTLHRVANTFDQKQGEVTFGLYLKICLTNCLRSRARERARRLRAEQRARENEKTGNYGGSSDGRSGELEALSARAEEPGLLSAYERKVYSMIRAGKSCAEISSELGRPVKSVYNAKVRIKEKLSGKITPKPKKRAAPTHGKNESVARRNRSRKESGEPQESE